MHTRTQWNWRWEYRQYHTHIKKKPALQQRTGLSQAHWFKRLLLHAGWAWPHRHFYSGFLSTSLGLYRDAALATTADHILDRLKKDFQFSRLFGYYRNQMTSWHTYINIASLSSNHSVCEPYDRDQEILQYACKRFSMLWLHTAMSVSPPVTSGFKDRTNYTRDHNSIKRKCNRKVLWF